MMIKLLAVFLCFTTFIVYSADFKLVFTKIILPHEGGYSENPDDPGNWTGGKKGEGELKGTKYGISAKTYPNLDIKNLTIEQAEAIYKREYWDSCHFGDLKSQGIAEELCDEVVNMGIKNGQALLAKVFDEIDWATKSKTKVKAEFTPETIEWINQYTKERSNRISFYNSIKIKRVKFYLNLVHKNPAMRQFLLSWIDRTIK